MDDSSARNPLRIPWLWTLAVILADQFTKHLAVIWLKPPAGYISVVRDLFNLCYVENQGAAWGMLAGRQVFLIAFSVVVLAIFFWKRQKIFGNVLGGGWIFATLLGGVIGNLIDRARLGYVIDFLDFHWGPHHFPAFNVADAAICCSALALILMQWVSERRRK